MSTNYLYYGGGDHQTADQGSVRLFYCRSKSVGAGLDCAVCTLALSVTQERCCSCSMQFVALCMSYMRYVCVTLPSQRYLRSAERSLLHVPRHRLNTYGCPRAFAIAGPSASAWNSLLSTTQTATGVSFRCLLKAFPDIRLLWHFCVYTLCIEDLAVF